MGITVLNADMKRLMLTIVVMTIVAVLVFNLIAKYATGLENLMDQIIDSLGNLI